MKPGPRLFEEFGGVDGEVAFEGEVEKVGAESGDDAGLGAFGDADVAEVGEELAEGVYVDVA